MRITPALAAAAAAALLAAGCGGTAESVAVKPAAAKQTQQDKAEAKARAALAALKTFTYTAENSRTTVERQITRKLNRSLGYTDTVTTCFPTAKQTLACHAESKLMDDASNATVTIDPKTGAWMTTSAP